MDLVVRCLMALALAVTFALPSRKANASVEILADSPTRVPGATVGVEVTSNSAVVDLLFALRTRRASVSVDPVADFLTKMADKIVVLLLTFLPTVPDQLVLAMLSSVVSVTAAILAVSLTEAMAEALIWAWAWVVAQLAFATSSRLVNASVVIHADIPTIQMLSSVLLRTLDQSCALLSRRENALAVISAVIPTRWRDIKWVPFYSVLYH
jgi:hypothetical protein